MKRFLYKTLLFLLTPILFYGLISVFFEMKFRNKLDDFEIMIFGDSQTEFINFSNIYNNSVHGSPYYLHYKFTRKFINQIKGKRIYIACNYHNLSNLYQNRLVDDSLFPGWRADMFEKLNEFNFINRGYSEIMPDDFDYSIVNIKRVPNLFVKFYFPK